MQFRTAVKAFLPPIIVTIFRRLFPARPSTHTVNWHGDYLSWKDANVLCNGYESEVILERCKSSLLKVKNGEYAYERDSVVFDKIQYSWPLLAGLQKTALENGGNLRVLDFGGSLGSAYYQNREFLSGVGKLQWCIVEQPNFVACGKQYFEDDVLKFYYSIEECTQVNKPDVVLLSGVLQYLEKPELVIGKLVGLGVKYIIIDRTAFVTGGRDMLTIQNVPASIYKASYPAWFFNKEMFLNRFAPYKLLAEFDSGFTPSIVINELKGSWRGFILSVD